MYLVCIDKMRFESPLVQSNILPCYIMSRSGINARIRICQDDPAIIHLLDIAYKSMIIVTLYDSRYSFIIECHFCSWREN